MCTPFSRDYSRAALCVGSRSYLICSTLAVVSALTGMVLAAEGGESVKTVIVRINVAHRQNYESLERAPVRHWGELDQLRPLNDLLHAGLSDGRTMILPTNDFAFSFSGKIVVG